MKEFSYIIVEDIKSHREALEILMQPEKEKNLCPWNMFIYKGYAGTVDDALLLIKKQKPNLIFLDLKIGEADDGQYEFFSVIYSLTEKGVQLPQFIVTSGYEKGQKFIHEGIDVVDYLIKPINPKELKQALIKFDIDDRFIAIKTHEDGKEKFLCSNILYVETSGTGKDITIHTIHRTYTRSSSLKKIEQLFNEQKIPYMFRIHQSRIINTNFLKSIKTTLGICTIQYNDEQIELKGSSDLLRKLRIKYFGN